MQAPGDWTTLSDYHPTHAASLPQHALASAAMTLNSEMEPREGFAHVAHWAALDQDNETLIFRKFGELGARNLLILQTELQLLEGQLAEYDTHDAKSEDLDVKDAARTWEVTLKKKKAGEADACYRVQLLLDVRKKLKEYQEALLLQNEIARLRRPNGASLKAYRHWFSHPAPALGGTAKAFLDNDADLVGLGATSETDYLSRLLRKHWPVQREFFRDGNVHIGRLSEKTLTAAVAIVTTVIAALLLIGPILGLYFSVDDGAKLGMIAAFTAAFALSIGLLTSARRAEIFAATAAYAAVLVVFVSGDIKQSP